MDTEDDIDRVKQEALTLDETNTERVAKHLRTRLRNKPTQQLLRDLSIWIANPEVAISARAAEVRLRACADILRERRRYALIVTMDEGDE
jgi:hypothetical protein